MISHFWLSVAYGTPCSHFMCSCTTCNCVHFTYFNWRTVECFSGNTSNTWCPLLWKGMTTTKNVSWDVNENEKLVTCRLKNDHFVRVLGKSYYFELLRRVEKKKMVRHTILREALVLFGGTQRDVHSRLLLSAVVLNIQNCSLLSYVKHSLCFKHIARWRKVYAVERHCLRGNYWNSGFAKSHGVLHCMAELLSKNLYAHMFVSMLVRWFPCEIQKGHQMTSLN